MSGATTSIGEMVARIGIASARYELYERLARKALQKCTPKQLRALLKELKIEQYKRNMLKMSEKLSNKTCGECRKYKVAKKFWCLAVAPEHNACPDFEPKEDETCGEVCVAQNAKNDTQTDLRKADYTESEKKK